MKSNHKLDKSFGPVGSTAGIFLFGVGVVMAFGLWTGAILAIVGAFVGFSDSCSSIDIENRKVRYGIRLFGIFATGKWNDIKSDMRIDIKKSQKTWRTYSRSNRSFDTTNTDYRIVLFSSSGKELMPLQRFKKPEDAQTGLELLRKQLDLAIH